MSVSLRWLPSPARSFASSSASGPQRQLHSSLRTRPERSQPKYASRRGSMQPAVRLLHSDGRPELGPEPHFAKHLSTVLAPLEFPTELGTRILTHASHRAANVGHNARLAFLGRRVMEGYFGLFLASSRALQPSDDLEFLTDRALNTYLIGQHIAPHWQISKILRWAPSISPDMIRERNRDVSGRNLDVAETVRRHGPSIMQSVGLHKVSGEAVQAIVGGVFHQYGGSVAHRVFHTRVLPRILLPGSNEGVSTAFHEEALEICERMGGPDGSLLVAHKAKAIGKSPSSSTITPSAHTSQSPTGREIRLSA